MLKQVRQNIVDILWRRYKETNSQMQAIEAHFQHKKIHSLILDHFAIIDLPGPHTGISTLKQIFEILGYVEQGQDYLPTKQNDFLWMTEEDSHLLPAAEVLPQVVVADFRLQECPPEISQIIEKYAIQSAPCALADMKHLAQHASEGSMTAAAQLTQQVTTYLKGSDWPLPTVKEFSLIKEFNELMAWVLIFGRRPNHFTISTHHLDHFKSISEFHHFIEEELQLSLNVEGGKIKGGIETGIAQGSTKGIQQTVQLSDGNVQLPTSFVEFVWRYPVNHSHPPIKWQDYFRGFVPQYANRVIESLYLDQKTDNLCKVQG